MVNNVINKILCFVIGVIVTLMGVSVYNLANKALDDKVNQISIYEVVSGAGDLGEVVNDLVKDLQDLKVKNGDDNVEGKIEELVKKSGVDASTTVRKDNEGADFLLTVKTSNNYFFNVEGRIAYTNPSPAQ